MKNKKLIIILIMIIIVVVFICVKQLKKDNYNKLNINATIYKTYDEYNKMYSNIPKEEKQKYKELKKEDFEKNNYILLNYKTDKCSETIEKFDTKIKKNTLKAYYDINLKCGICKKENDIKIIKVDKNITEVNAYYKITKKIECENDIAYKPIIYIYPKEEIDLTIKFETTDNLLYTYPKYENEWNVHVTPDGNIKDYKTNKNYYALYWEAIDNTNIDMTKGFVVSGKDTIKFLEEKLSYLGLNEREINEFIIYWIDKIDNEYNYIYFRTTEEMNKTMPLQFSKNPDTLIRIMMDIKPLKEKINVTEQQLKKVERKGYTIVEWGGRILK